ncbi:MAG TPA: hypothetical protein VFP49_04640 [Nitrososphaeraceae archaeon]|nr:hypothetical protein [Nitrososphaeraceae archaeon]
MKSQRYRMSNDKVWKQIRQRIHDPFRYYKKGLKYGDYMLPSGYYVSQTYGALHKCWIGFVIDKEKWDWEKIDLYASRIQKLEKELGIEITDFSDWGID